jgi:hypothetical protein
LQSFSLQEKTVGVKSKLIWKQKDEDGSGDAEKNLLTY